MLLKATPTLAAAPKGLVGHWHLDEGSGKIAKDSSDEKNDGEIWENAKWVKEGVNRGGNFTGASLAFKPQSGLNIPAQGVDSLEKITAGLTLSAGSNFWGHLLKIRGISLSSLVLTILSIEMRNLVCIFMDLQTMVGSGTKLKKRNCR